ncbi:26182_t:CDS:1, partial [Gigaspora rosea]
TKSASTQPDQQPKTEIEIDYGHTDVTGAENSNSRTVDPYNQDDQSQRGTVPEIVQHVELDLEDAQSDTTMSLA